MDIKLFSDFVFEEEEFTKEDLISLLDAFDDDEFNELVDYIIDKFEDQEGDDEEGEEEIEFTVDDVKTLLDDLDDEKLADVIDFAIFLVGQEAEEDEEMEEAMSTAAKTRAAIKRKKPAYKKAMRKLRKCQKNHKNLPDNKACGTDGKIHTKRKLTARKKTRIKRKRLKKRITVK